MGTDYYVAITNALQGNARGLEGVPVARLDWYGSGAVLEMYESTAGADREEIIRAMGRIVESGIESPTVIAQVLHLAASLDLAQIQPSVERLERTALASEEPVKSAIQTYKSFRQFNKPSFFLTNS
jgi:hypothetical protein